MDLMKRIGGDRARSVVPAKAPPNKPLLPTALRAAAERQSVSQSVHLCSKVLWRRPENVALGQPTPVLGPVSDSQTHVDVVHMPV